MGKQMFSYHAIDLLRDIPQHLKDLIFLFQRNKTLSCCCQINTRK